MIGLLFCYKKIKKLKKYFKKRIKRIYTPIVGFANSRLKSAKIKFS